MKKIVLLILLAITVLSCQKEDDNGSLGGFWKLLEIEDQQTKYNTVDESRFWAIQLDLLEIRISDNDKHYCRFQHVGDSLFVQTIDDATDLTAFGIYENKNERYEILQLNDKNMILRSKFVTLTFRKF